MGRVGVCLDTCHLFAAGYDIRTQEEYEKTMTRFDEVVGLAHLKAIHLNDTKEAFHSNKDRHIKIGEGIMGEACFAAFMVCSLSPSPLSHPHTRTGLTER